MNARTILTGLMLLPLLIAVPAQAQTTDADFQMAVAAFQQAPSDTSAEKVIRLAAAMDRLPPVPEEARRHFVRGTTLFKDAKSADNFKLATDEFSQTVNLAPWWPDARYNEALALEGQADYAGAIANLKLYLLFKLPDSEARAAQDKIYALEAKQEEAAKVAQDQAQAQRAAEEEQRRAEQQRGADEARRQGLIDDPGAGLQWVRAPDQLMLWGDANTYVQSLSLDGGGWRLPSAAELRSLYARLSSLGGAAAFNAANMFVWSSDLSGSSAAWSVLLSSGDWEADSFDHARRYVLAVRYRP